MGRVFKCRALELRATATLPLGGTVVASLILLQQYIPILNKTALAIKIV